MKGSHTIINLVGEGGANFMLIKDIFAIFVFIQQETKMRIFKRIALTAVLFLIASVSSLAVFNEKDLAQTLQVLRYELRKAYIEMEKNQMSLRVSG